MSSSKSEGNYRNHMVLSFPSLSRELPDGSVMTWLRLWIRWFLQPVHSLALYPL